MKHPVCDRRDARKVPVFILHRREAERLEAREGLAPKERQPLGVGLKGARSESLEIRAVSSSRERMRRGLEVVGWIRRQLRLSHAVAPAASPAPSETQS